MVTITQDEDGMFIAECPSIPGCVSQGKTAEEAEMNVQDAIRVCLEVRAEIGKYEPPSDAGSLGHPTSVAQIVHVIDTADRFGHRVP